MIDLTSEIHIQRLFAAIDSSRDGMKPFRENRTSMLKEYVGSHYNGNGAPYEVIVNLIAQTADVYTIGLAANNPKVNITTNSRELLPFANRFKVGINNQIKRNEVFANFAKYCAGLPVWSWYFQNSFSRI